MPHAQTPDTTCEGEVAGPFQTLIDLERAIATDAEARGPDGDVFGPGAPGSELRERLDTAIERAAEQLRNTADPPAPPALRAAIDDVLGYVAAATSVSAELTASLEDGLAADEWRQWPLPDRVRLFTQITGLYRWTGASTARVLLPGLTRLYETLLTPALHPGHAAELYDQVRMLSWMVASDAGTLESFGGVVEPLAKHVRRWAAVSRPSPRVTPGSPPYRLAYLLSGQGLAVNTAVPRVIWSVLHGHRKIASGRVELFLYSWRGLSDELRQEIEALGVVVRACSWETSPCAALARIRGQITADRIDVLLSDSNAGLPTVLFETRSAPAQIYLDMGLSAWGGTGVDYTLLGFNGDPRALGLAAGTYEPIEWRFDERFVRLACDPREIAAQRARFAGARHVFCYVGRLVKLTPEYLLTAREILRRVPDAVFYLGGHGDDAVVRETLAAFGDAASRVVVDAKTVDGPVMVSATDTFLDSFPFLGGLSCLQAQGAGRPVAYLADSRPGYARLQALSRDEGLRAASVEDYIAIAERLATSPEEWAFRSSRTAAIVDRSSDVTVQARAIEAAVERLLRRG